LTDGTHPIHSMSADFLDTAQIRQSTSTPCLVYPRADPFRASLPAFLAAGCVSVPGPGLGPRLVAVLSVPCPLRTYTLPEDLSDVSWRRRTWVRAQRHYVVFCRAWNEGWLLSSTGCVDVSAASHTGSRAEGGHVLGQVSVKRAGPQVEAKAHDKRPFWSVPFCPPCLSVFLSTPTSGLPGSHATCLCPRQGSGREGKQEVGRWVFCKQIRI
jgi:hypothetical protein